MGSVHAMEAAAVNRGDDQSGVVGDDEAVGVFGIEPDVVGVAAPALLFESSCRRRATAGTNCWRPALRCRWRAKQPGECNSRRGRSARADSSPLSSFLRHHRSATRIPDRRSGSARRPGWNWSARWRHRSCPRASAAGRGLRCASRSSRHRAKHTRRCRGRR